MVWVLLPRPSPHGRQRWRDRASRANHGVSARPRGASGVGRPGMGPARPRLPVLSDGASSLGSRGIGSPSWIRCSQLLASSPPAHSAPRALLRAQAPGPAQQLLGRAAPRKKDSSAASQGQQHKTPGRAGVQPCPSSGLVRRALTVREALAVGPPGAAAGPNDVGARWSAVSEIGESPAGAHQGSMSPAVPIPARAQARGPQSAKCRAQASQVGAGSWATALWPSLHRWCSRQHGGHPGGPQNRKPGRLASAGRSACPYKADCPQFESL